MLPHANAIKHTKIELHCATGIPLLRIPGNDDLLAGENDFTERAAIEMVERLFKFIKAVAVLNDRLQARDINSPDKILQRPAMSHANP